MRGSSLFLVLCLGCLCVSSSPTHEFGGKFSKRAHQVNFGQENNVFKRAHEVEFGGNDNIAKREFGGSNNDVSLANLARDVTSKRGPPGEGVVHSVRTCELHHGGSDLALSCSDDHVIQIQQASYGRTEDGICPGGDGVHDCNKDVADTVKELCEGAGSCTVSPTNELAGDPCPEVPKYLTISYVCVEVKTATSCELHHGGAPMTLSCSDDKVIQIEEATYGRTEFGICPRGPHKNLDCSRDVSSKVKDKCEGDQSCSISPTNRFAGDPCPEIPKYLKIGYFCNPVTTLRSCEVHHGGNDLYLSCSAGRKINIQHATYGRTEDGVCPGGEGVFNCNKDVSDEVEEMCGGVYDCTVTTTNSAFGDPCPGIPKYLTISYVCE